ncbi:hypothetical protein [uncultured Shewanella sp.]|uniref:hypothetical protein n=1 Tax=uncultured Shewanella sp. TaxID=173975 RepID=UPI0026176898|nr:hypothetical protein [uncultured Shewanella sp.]
MCLIYKLLKRLIVTTILLILSATALASECQLPKKLVGKVMILHIYGIISPSNPLANQVIEMHFDRQTYLLKNLQTGAKFMGKYTYRRFESDLAELRVEEQKVANNINKVAYYTETFVCQTNVTGYYIFSAIAGVMRPLERQNTGRYFFR